MSCPQDRMRWSGDDEPSHPQEEKEQGNATKKGNAKEASPANDESPKAPPHEDGDEQGTEQERRKGSGSVLKHTEKNENPSGGRDCTPIADAPAGYTVKFTFHRAKNLPPADFSSGSADPFLTAQLGTSAPKRHKEDPDLTFRTPTIRKTTNPEWNAEWIVANIPASGFNLKCRLYDEDYPDRDDRLGNAMIKVAQISEEWAGFPAPGKEFVVKKRMGSKRAYAVKALASIISTSLRLTPSLWVSIEVLGKSNAPHAMVYTVGPPFWIKHFSPMIGRITGTMVHENETHGPQPDSEVGASGTSGKRTKKFDFQANEMQLSGPVPSSLYHRYVAFKPIINVMFSSSGLRGKILNKALHSQHSRIYNFDRTTERGTFKPCSEGASLCFLRMAHFDDGGRVFTYALTLDSMFRFTETGEEFGIDMLSKHTMHADVATYIACAGEFFIRRLEKPNASNDPEPDEATHPTDQISGGPPCDSPPLNPKYYQLIIDNDSGTYRPDKAILPDLKAFLEKNFPGLGIVALHWEDEELQKLKAAQHMTKKKEGRKIPMVLRNVSSSSSSMSSNENRLAGMESSTRKLTKATALDVMEDPKKVKGLLRKENAAVSGTRTEQDRPDVASA